MLIVNQVSLGWNTIIENLTYQYGILKKFIQIPQVEPNYLAFIRF